MQDGKPTADMIRDVPDLIEFLSQSTTCCPARSFFTGTTARCGHGANAAALVETGRRGQRYYRKKLAR